MEDGAAKRLTVTEAARRLGVHPNTLRRLVDRGVVPAIRLPGSGYRRFDPLEIERIRREMGLGSLNGEGMDQPTG